MIPHDRSQANYLVVHWRLVTGSIMPWAGRRQGFPWLLERHFGVMPLQHYSFFVDKKKKRLTTYLQFFTYLMGHCCFLCPFAVVTFPYHAICSIYTILGLCQGRKGLFDQMYLQHFCGFKPHTVQCLILMTLQVTPKFIGFLSKSQISEKIPSTFWRVFWCAQGCFCY